MSFIGNLSLASARVAISAPTTSWPIKVPPGPAVAGLPTSWNTAARRTMRSGGVAATTRRVRSEEHTSELQSRPHLVCRLLLEKKKNKLRAHYQHNLKE